MGLGHLLLALCDDAVVAGLLENLSVAGGAVREEAARLTAARGIMGDAAGDETTEQRARDPALVAAVERAFREARNLGQREVGSADLLLGVVGAAQGSAGAALERLGLKAESLRALIIQAIVLGDASERAWRSLRDVLAGTHTQDEVWQLAEQLKLYSFDRLLHTNLAHARRMARFIELLGEVADCPRASALGVLARADAARQSGDPGDAVALFEQAGAMFLRAGDRVGWARAWTGRLIALAQAGMATDEDLKDADEARRVLRESASLYRQANLEQNIAVTLQRLGRYEEAVAAFDRGLERLGDASGQAETDLRAMLLMNKANALLWQGDLDLAGTLHAQAQATFVQIGNTGLAAIEVMNRSLVERLRGRFQEALQLARTAIDGLLEMKLPGDAAEALTYRADTLLLLNRCEEAVADAARAVEMLRPLQVPSDLAAALSIEARALLRCGERARALACLAEGERVAMKVRHLRVAYPVAIERALLLLSQDQAAEAREAALSVLRTPVIQGTRVHQAMAMLLVGEADLALGQIAQAQTMVQEGLEVGERLDAPELVYRGHLLLARAARQQGRLDVALRHYDQMGATLRTLVRDLVHDQPAEFLEDKDDLYMEALLVALDAGETPRALAYLEESRARAVWGLSGVGAQGGHERAEDAEIELLRTRHRYISTSLATLRSDSPARMGATDELKRLARAIRDRLEARAERMTEATGGASLREAGEMATRATTLAYALAREDLVIFAIREGEVHVQRVPGGARALRKCAHALRLDIDILAGRLGSAGAGARAVLAREGEAIRERLAELWSLAIAPVEFMLPAEGEPLVIVPHGIMRALPMPAMFDGGRYLVERWVVHCAPSCRTPKPQPRAPALAQRPILALGCSNEGRLLNAVEEAREVAALLGGDAWIEDDASGERLRRDGGRCSYLHVAAHAVVRIDEPEGSFVQLADGAFLPADVMHLDLCGCRLVTLSACRTAQGRLRGGDEQIGLMRAFGRAGAESVLAALWQVEDASTRGLMRGVYARLARGLSPAEALRGAQVAFIQGSEQPGWAHPYFWGGFQLMTYAAPANDPEAATAEEASATSPPAPPPVVQTSAI